MDIEEFLEQVEQVIDSIDVDTASESELRHSLQAISQLVETMEEDEDEDEEQEYVEADDDEEEEEEEEEDFEEEMK